MSEGHLAAFRDLTDKKDVVFHGPGSFHLGKIVLYKFGFSKIENTRKY